MLRVVCVSLNVFQWLTGATVLYQDRISRIISNASNILSIGCSQGLDDRGWCRAKALDLFDGQSQCTKLGCYESPDIPVIDPQPAPIYLMRPDFFFRDFLVLILNVRFFDISEPSR